MGWELHLADKQETAPGKRLLKYMPICIYVKFQEMSERIHETFAPGVSPIEASPSDMDRESQDGSQDQPQRPPAHPRLRVHRTHGARLDVAGSACRLW